MEIIGNKICSVCMSLNSARRKYCQKCRCILKNKVISGSSRPVSFDKRQLKENKHIYTFREVFNNE